MIIRPERKEDIECIRIVNKEAFDSPEKDPGLTEWDLVDQIRESDDFIKELSIVAEVEDQIVGHILYSPMSVGEIKEGILALAPMAVLPQYQGKGIGSQLIRHSIEKAKELGYGAIIVLGHKDYYPKFGFKLASIYGIGFNDDYTSEYLFALELKEGFLDDVLGNVKYCPAFYSEDGELI